MISKTELRKVLRDARNILSSEEIIDSSSQIQSRLLAYEPFLQSDVIYTYVSYQSEVNTIDMIRICLQMGKRVAVPKVNTSDRKMEFYWIHHLEELKRGYQNILEPTTTVIADVKKIFMILPGLGFDIHKNRIGYGGGYYDRYLETHQDCMIHKVALAYDSQMLEQLPIDDFDYPMDCIITPNQWI